MESKVHLADLAQYSEQLYTRAEATYVHALNAILPDLQLWIQALQDHQTEQALSPSLLSSFWEFRKTLNAYISVIVHCTPDSHIPQNISDLSHFIGQVKDCLLNGLTIDDPQTQHWVRELATVMQQPLTVAIEPQTPTENTITLQRLKNDIFSFTFQHELSAGNMHLLRKRIRAFMHSYAVLTEKKFSAESGEHFIKDKPTRLRFKLTMAVLKEMCDELGEIHDHIVTETLQEVSTYPGTTFESQYNQKAVTLPAELRIKILSVFAYADMENVLFSRASAE